MSVRFFGTTCSEPSRNDERFGLCDDDNAERAYSDSADQSKWIATVVNEQQRPVVFTAVDHCIKKRNLERTMMRVCVMEC